MGEAKNSPAPRAVTSPYPALFILAFAAGVLIWAQTYSEIARRFPTLVAGALVVLALIDLWSRTRLPGRRFIADFWGAEFDRREMTHDPTLRREAGLLAWILGCFAAMALVGVLVAMPLFCLLFTWLRSGRPLRLALLVAAIVLAFEFIVFEWLLDYELYRGLLFSGGGLSAW